MYQNNRNAFTMIELVFVIVIIGILAAVAIPRLMANRDQVSATVCVHAATLLVQELASYYNKHGAWDAMNKITNIQTNIPLVAGNQRNGILDASTVVPDISPVTVTYVCNGEAIAVITPMLTPRVIRGTIHNELGLVISNPGTATLLPGRIAITLLTRNGYYRVAPGYIVGGN